MDMNGAVWLEQRKLPDIISYYNFSSNIFQYNKRKKVEATFVTITNWNKDKISETCRVRMKPALKIENVRFFYISLQNSYG